MRIDQAKQTIGDYNSQTCSMKSIGSSWENLIIQLGLKGLNNEDGNTNDDGSEKSNF